VFRHEVIAMFDTVDKITNENSMKMWSTFSDLNNMIDADTFVPAAVRVRLLKIMCKT
jgi:hypothetical protein